MLIPNESEIAARAINVVEKLWGREFWLVNTKKYCCKLLKIKPGFISSLHSHPKKDETFYGLMGVVQLITQDGDGQHTFIITAGRQHQIAPGTPHSFQAVGESWILEVSTHHDDKDVIRLQPSRKLEP
jgi:quercetin dioxygenase-like cupin family protein